MCEFLGIDPRTGGTWLFSQKSESRSLTGSSSPPRRTHVFDPVGDSAAVREIRATSVPRLAVPWSAVGFLLAAFFLAAFISGSWNQRIYRLQQFQKEILDNMNSGFLITNAKGILLVQNDSARTPARSTWPPRRESP